MGVTASPTITVASYNMRKAIGIDRKRKPDRILHVLQQIDADVVALQEADKRVGGRGAAVPHELIDEHGLYKPVPFRVRHRRALEMLPGGLHAERLLKLNTRNLGWHGNALLVKPHIGILDVAALDRIIVDHRLGIEAAGVHASPEARTASDHLPIWARVTL